MNKEKQLNKTFIALLLFVALALPTIIQFSHVFESHSHEQCNIVNAHIHQDKPDCQICDFHLVSFNYDIIKYPKLECPIIPVKKITNFHSLQDHSFKITNTQLRAPPSIS